MDFLIYLNQTEKIFSFSLIFLLIVFIIYVLSKKNIIKNKDGISITDSVQKKEISHEWITPVWSKLLPNGKDNIGVYSFGNYTRIYGNHWNSTLDIAGHKLIKKIVDPSYDIGEGNMINYDFWIFDIRNMNIHSTLLSLFVDKSKLFKQLYIIADSKSIPDLKPILPENSKIKNIKFLIE